MTEVYNIEPEELDEIEYYEIITLDEIIKENPTFIAFSRDEIFDELYNFFKNSNKASMLTDLFYKNNNTDIINYVFVADAKKKEVNDDINDFVEDFAAMTKMVYHNGQVEKNKYFFALTYDMHSERIRLKPYAKTTIEIEIEIDKKKINLFYPVFGHDDTNIPILAAYYNTPTSTTNDYLSQKVISHTMKKEPFNYAKSDAYSDINKLISVVKPKMQTIVEKMQIEEDDFDLDYNNLNNILNRFNTSLEDIHINDFEILKEHLQPILEIKPHTINYKKYKIKDITVSNDKIEFFNKIQNIINLLTFSEEIKQEYALLITSLEDEKMNINAPPLLYNTINDIVNAVINNEIQLEEIVENLDANRKVWIINNAINTTKGINANDIENITVMLQDITERFKSLQGTVKDIFDLHFIDLYADIKEIKEANDYTGYAGTPAIYKNDPNFEGIATEDDDLQDITIDISVNKISKMSLEKYWLSIDYKDARGFTEMLKIVLPIINNVQELAVLQLNYDVLCKELYNRFSGIPTKFDIMRNIFMNADMKMSDEYIRDVIKITPAEALSQSTSSDADNVSALVQQCNKEFIVYLYDMLYTAIAWWSLVIQEDVLNDTLIFDMNLCQAAYIDKWTEDELPLKESKQEKGVLPYIAVILEDIMMENNEMGLPHGIIKNSMKIVDTIYSETIQRLRNNAKDMTKKKDKGAETYTNLLETIKERKKNRLLNDYIDALMYMPSYKYKKIHKFLLGCCLQKIGKEFSVDSDIDPNNRKGLIAAKKKYAANRETTKPRYAMYVPEPSAILEKEKPTKKTNLPDDDSDSDDITHSQDLILPDIQYDNGTNEQHTITAWFESMYDKSPLLPNKLLNEFKAQKSTNIAKDYADAFIQCVCKTSKHTHQEFAGLFFNEKSVNYKNIMNILCTIFNTSPTETDDEKLLLQTAITNIQDVLKDMEKLIECVNEENIADIIRIKKYIAARALCLPCNPDNAKNHILYASINVSNGFINRISDEVYNTVIKYLRMIKMPTMEDNIKFINSIREQYKVKILNVMNKKTIEERDLMSSLKKIGLKYNDADDMDDEGVNDQIVLNPDKNNDELNDFDEDFIDTEAEYTLGAEDEYNDEDDLDRTEYGFIYS